MRTVLRKLASVAVALSLIAVLSGGRPAWGQIGFRQVTSTHPVAVQRGTTAELKLRSNFTLDETYAVFTHPGGLQISYAETEPIQAERKGRGSVGTPFRFRVEVPEQQLPGVYEYRVATRQAVSSVAQLLVTDFPVVTESDAENGNREAAQQVPIPAAVCGVCEAFEDVDCFRFQADKDQTLVLEIFAQRVTDRIHSMVVKGPRIYLMDPILTLYGPNGQVLAQNDNFFGGDSLISFTAPADGEYVVEVRDARYAGNARYTYCLEISDRPRAFATLPLAVQRGQETEGYLITNHSDQPVPTKLVSAEKQATEASSPAAAWDQRRYQHPGGLANPVALLTSDLPQILEAEASAQLRRAAGNSPAPEEAVAGVSPPDPANSQSTVTSSSAENEPDTASGTESTESGRESGTESSESSTRGKGANRPTSANNSPETAEPITLPLGISGNLAVADDVDYYRLEAVEGELITLEVTARRVDSPLDSVLEVYDSKGKLLAEADDLTSHVTKDSRLTFKAPGDGVYFVAVRDLHGRGGTRYVYHLEVRRGHPDFELFGEYYYAQLAPGTRMIWFARIERQNGFDGPVTIEVEDLPAGVAATPVTIPAGMDHCGIILSAVDEAEISAALVRVRGTATVEVDGQPTRLIRYGHVRCEQQSSGGGQARYPIHTQIVGVTKPLDLKRVTASPAEVTLARGESAEIEVTIERNEDFNEAVTLDTAFTYFQTVLGAQLPPGVTLAAASKTRLTKDKVTGTLILEADAKKALLVDKFPIAAVARVSITFSITTNYASNPILLTVTE